jgi:hypothetical protein
MNKIIVGSLILILLVSGCSNLPFNIPFLSNSGTQVKELPSDVISIQNMTVLPSTSVRERDQFSVYFDLMNEDEFSEADSSYSIYDTGLCNWTGGDPNSKNGTIPLYPQEIKSVEWNFKAPSAEEIANLRVTCPIRFRFDFDYQAKSQIDILVAKSDYLTQLQRAGKSTTFSPTVNVGRGPIKIYFDFGTTLPARNNSDLTVYVRAEDKGSGMLNEIKAGNFTVTFPSEFDLSKVDCPYFDKCPGNKCTSNADIPIISKKSLDIRCSGITTPDSSKFSDEKTYFINATLNYSYYVAGEVDVQVNP